MSALGPERVFRTVSSTAMGELELATMQARGLLYLMALKAQDQDGEFDPAEDDELEGLAVLSSETGRRLTAAVASLSDEVFPVPGAPKRKGAAA